jgi:hypothetical protein
MERRILIWSLGIYEFSKLAVFFATWCSPLRAEPTTHMNVLSLCVLSPHSQKTVFLLYPNAPSRVRHEKLTVAQVSKKLDGMFVTMLTRGCTWYLS